MQPDPRPGPATPATFDFFGADRLGGLEPAAAALVKQAAQALARRDLDGAGGNLTALGALAAAHPETLRVRALLERGLGRLDVAADLMQRALFARPNDPLLLGDMSALAAERGDAKGAIDRLREATRLAPTHVDLLFRFAVTLDRNAHSAEALALAERVLTLAPAHPHAPMLAARGLQACGRIDEAASTYRRIAAAGGPRSWQAWFSLVDLKTVRLDAREHSALKRLAEDETVDAEVRTTLAFALGKVQEDAGCHADAFATFERGNVGIRRNLHWDAAAFARDVMRSIDVFANVSSAASAGLGSEVIFIVGMPRSGTTLVEQILAAHPMVEGASELPDLPAVLAAESRRRGTPLHEWAAHASAQDWERLGLQYLERTARWRTSKPRSTDKLPDNWASIGAIRSMLPGAKIIDCRRDPVETCWSCYKQLFAPGRASYAYDLDDLAAYFGTYAVAMQAWKTRYPDCIAEIKLARLVSEPTFAIASLLGSCDLAFEPACLDFGRAARAVRTPSAAQVREGLHTDNARARRYGNRLDGLRAALLAPPSQPVSPESKRS